MSGIISPIFAICLISGFLPQVGSVVFVGLIKAGEGVDWRVLINVAASWVVTLPASALFSAGIMLCLDYLLLK